MTKVNPNFSHDMFTFLHRPLRLIDSSQGENFLERFLSGPQALFEEVQAKISSLPDILDPAKTRKDLLQFLKDHVGFTKELNNITQDLSENDLRKLISLAVALWKQKGTEPGYENIVRLFTGKAVRIFNWFDFRLIVGEKAFGEEQLGEDSWLISVPGIEATQDNINTVVSLLTFEGNLKDRSLVKNNATANGSIYFHSTPATGFPQDSKKYVRFSGGHILQTHSSAYDFSGGITIEFFLRTTTLQPSKTLFRKKDLGGVGIEILIDTAFNKISFSMSDGVNTASHDFFPMVSLVDGILRHLALVFDRANGVKLFFNGTESTPLIPVSSLGDLTNSAPILVGGSGDFSDAYMGDMDNFRLCLNPVYSVLSASIPPPITGFIEYQEEGLDEYFTDVRIVDEGDLNKPLMLRILNLMRPVSERLNVIFIRFFDDFSAGSGRFVNLQGSSRINNDDQLEIDPNSLLSTDVLGDGEFQDIILQVKANDKDTSGGIYSIVFFVQNIFNYYEYRVDSSLRLLSLHKTIAGVASQIGPSVSVDIVPHASYIFSVQTRFDPANSNTLIQTFFDSNRIHKITDSSFEKGKFGMKTGSMTTMQVDEIEMFELPLDVRRITPGFNL